MRVVHRTSPLGLELGFELPRAIRRGERMLLRAVDPIEGPLRGADGFRDDAGSFAAVAHAEGRRALLFVPNGAVQGDIDPVFVAGLADERDALDALVVFRAPWSGRRRPFDPLAPVLPAIGLALHVAFAEGHATPDTLRRLAATFATGGAERVRALTALGPPASVRDCGAAWVRFCSTSSVADLFDVLFGVARGDGRLSEARADALREALDAVSPGSFETVRARVEEAVRRGGTRDDDAWRLLGVDPAEGLDAARARYLEQLKRAHPDRHGSASPGVRSAAEARTRELTDAWARLRDGQDASTDRIVPRPSVPPDPARFGIVDAAPWAPLSRLDPETLRELDEPPPVVRTTRAAPRPARRDSSRSGEAAEDAAPLDAVAVIVQAARRVVWPGVSLIPVAIVHMLVLGVGAALCFPFGALLVVVVLGPLLIASLVASILAVADGRLALLPAVAPLAESFATVWATGIALVIGAMLAVSALSAAVFAVLPSGEPLPMAAAALLLVLSHPLLFLWLLWACATCDGRKDAIGGLLRVGGILRRDGAEVAKILLAVLLLGTIIDLPAVVVYASRAGEAGLAAEGADGRDVVAGVLGLSRQLVSLWAGVAAAVTYRAGTARRQSERRAA